MSKPILNGHELDPLDRIITLGKDISGRKDEYSITIDKKDGQYILTITQFNAVGNPAFYRLDDKIPPDTSAEFISNNNHTPNFVININNPTS
jgi:hypothetical protein